MPQQEPSTSRLVQVGLLAWLIPGAGHYAVGQKGLAAVFCVAITLPYATGLAIGGAKSFASPTANRWLFVAELPIGGYTLPAYLLSTALDRRIETRRQRGETVDLTEYVAYFPAADVAQIYLATAGLLNILAILDALSRAQYGEPTFHRDRRPAPEEPPAA